MGLVAEKFKQTELGLIPSDWELKTLGEIFEFKNGLNKEKEFFGYGTPIVNYMDVFRNAGIYKSNIEGKVFLTPQEIKNYEVRKGDVFFTRTSETVEEIGISTVVLEELDKTVFSGFVLRGRPKNSILELSFKKYCFASVLVRKQITTTASYTTRALTNGRLLSNVKIPVPTKTEQIAIATALSDADALISGLEKLIAKKRDIKQVAMQKLLQPNTGWEVKRLGEMIMFIIDNRGKTPQIQNQGFPLIEVNSIYKQGKFPNYNLVTKFVDEATYKNWFRDGHPLKGDILVVTVGSAGATSFINNEMGCIAQNIIALRINPKYSNEFVYYFTETNRFKQQVSEVLMGGVQPSFKVPHLNNFIISVPPTKDEQTRIATILSDMDAEISALETKLEKYKKVKLGMMQNLLTGKIRLV